MFRYTPFNYDRNPQACGKMKFNSISDSLRIITYINSTTCKLKRENYLILFKCTYVDSSFRCRRSLACKHNGGQCSQRFYDTENKYQLKRDFKTTVEVTDDLANSYETCLASDNFKK